MLLSHIYYFINYCNMSETKNESSPKPMSTEKLMKDISFDKRIDGMDKKEVGALEQKYTQEKQEISTQTKEKLLLLIEKSLRDGFSVETPDDYEVLKKLLSILWKKEVLPEYHKLQHIADRTGKNFFSVAYDGDKNILKMYTKLPQEMEKNKSVESFSFMGDISLADGSFTPKNVITQYQSDYLRNNNQFDTQE